MTAGKQQRIVERCRLVEIKYPRNAARLRRLADRCHKIRIAIIEEHGVGLRDSAFGILRRDRAQTLIATCRDCFFSSGVNQNQRYRRNRTRDANSAAAIDFLAHQAFKNTACKFVVLRAEWAGKAHMAAEPCYGNRSVSGLATGRDQEFGRLNLCAGIRELVHAHDDVLYGAARAQDAWIFFATRLTQNGPRPLPTRE